MTNLNSRPARTKALLAMAFAGNLLTSLPQALCREANHISVSASTIEIIEKNALALPDVKAYYLLQLAYCVITGGDTTALETQLKSSLGQSNSRTLYQEGRRGISLSHWASSVSLLSHSEPVQRETLKKPISSEDRAFADKAIVAAMAQLGRGYENPQALNLYLVASSLSRITGNTLNEQKCNKILNDACQAREVAKTVDATQIKAIASILDSMSYGLVPIRIPDYQGQPTENAQPIEMKNFDKGERLKLRAAALLDRLPSVDQERRKAHRDLALWYLRLGKNEKSTQEKQTLFKLVGVSDDKILYPQAGSCGHPVWWSLAKVEVFTKCGMG